MTRIERTSHRRGQNLTPFSILALGSPHGDDQTAWAAAGLLKSRRAWASQVIPVRSPWEIVQHLRETRLAIVLDACQSGAEPGLVHRWTRDNLSELPPGRTSTHAGSLSEALQLAAALGDSPEVVVLGVEIAACDPCGKLSDAALRGAESLVRQVCAELQNRRLDDQG